MKHFNHTLAKEARDEKRDMATKTIEEGVKALIDEMKAGKSDRYLDYLRFAGQFHKYSAANQWLILGQCRARGVNPSYVASYKAWTDMGYQVREGKNTAIYIWAPRPYTYERENKATGEMEERGYTRFVLVPVFDASRICQGTNPETGEPYKELPTFFYPLPSNEQAASLYSQLVQVAKADGFTCIEEERTDGTQGWSLGKTICVRTGRDALSMFLTLIHEYAHGLLHWDGVERSKQQKEAEAESCAFIVASHFGLHNPFSSDYLQSWGNDEITLMQYLDRITKTAHSIIEKIEGAAQAPREEAA
jgi:N-terminal domain of anti-restriction factor ArdC